MANTLFEYDTVINADSVEAIPNSYDGMKSTPPSMSRLFPFRNVSTG